MHEDRFQAYTAQHRRAGPKQRQGRQKRPAQVRRKRQLETRSLVTLSTQDVSQHLYSTLTKSKSKPFNRSVASLPPELLRPGRKRPQKGGRRGSSQKRPSHTPLRVKTPQSVARFRDRPRNSRTARNSGRRAAWQTPPAKNSSTQRQAPPESHAPMSPMVLSHKRGVLRLPGIATLPTRKSPTSPSIMQQGRGGDENSSPTFNAAALRAPSPLHATMATSASPTKDIYSVLSSSRRRGAKRQRTARNQFRASATKPTRGRRATRKPVRPLSKRLSKAEVPASNTTQEQWNNSALVPLPTPSGRFRHFSTYAVFVLMCVALQTRNPPINQCSSV